MAATSLHHAVPRTTYHSIAVDGGVNVSYAEAGAASALTVLLLHGFPSSSNQYRNLIPLLADKYHVLAPDYPGFGTTTYPADYKFDFAAFTNTISAFLQALNITSYAIYIFDYGAPVGLRLALQDPDAVKAIISQNGNAYIEGFGHPFWDPIFQLWKSGNASSDREVLRENGLTLEATKAQYTIGFPDKDLPLVDPVSYHYDYLANLQGKANQDRQIDIFYDYRTNVDLYPRFQEYFRERQVPLLAIWGKGDVIFIPPGAEAFKRDLPNAVVKFVDAGHFALETKVDEIAKEVRGFLEKIGYI